MTWIYELESKDLSELLGEWNEPFYRAKQIQNWLRQGVYRPEEMTNLPKRLRAKMDGYFDSGHMAILDRRDSREDGSIKFLLAIGETDCVEAVVMHYDYGNTLCLSSQIGCRMGCTFCASTEAGFRRSLTAGEMLAQYAMIRRASGLEIQRVVVMGIGEPLEDVPALLKFIERLHGSYEISRRRVTISTCGLVPGIDELREANSPLTLAISLHSAIQAKRAEIMPIARRYPLPELLKSLEYYFAATHRRISYEYMMIRDFNDGEEDLEALIETVKQVPGHVNLIPLNEHPGMSLRPSKPERLARFEAALESKGIPVTRRRSLGGDIAAACGQLRRQTLAKRGGDT